MCVHVCVWGGGGVGLLPNKCYWCMDVLLREHKVYVDTVKLITNIKICKKTKQKQKQNKKQKKANKYIKPYFKTALKMFYFN